MPIMTARIKANIKHLSPGCSDFMHACSAVFAPACEDGLFNNPRSAIF